MKIPILILLSVSLIITLFSIISFNSSFAVKSDSSQLECKGKALCINGKIIKIIDGDTLWAKEKDTKIIYKIRLSLTSTPELYDKNHTKIKEGWESKKIVTKMCPVGSSVIVDQDDKQLKSYKRILAKITCNGDNLNAKLLSVNPYAKLSKQFCKKSEFADEDWAKKYGC